jgi:hypothetical protein
MTSETKCQVDWININEPPVMVIITNENVNMQNRCVKYYRVPEIDISKQSKCVPNLKILATYHNPRGGDFVIYDNGMVSDICWQNKVGILKRCF